MTDYFGIDVLSVFVGAFILIMTVLAAVYSIGSMRGRPGLARYFGFLTLAGVVSLGAVGARHWAVFLMCWGALVLPLYLLIGFGKTPNTSKTAKKALVIVGGSDLLMMLGVALLWRITGSLRMEPVHLSLSGGPAVAAYLCLAGGAFAKAGCLPFHSWVPDVAADAPASVAALLPAALDKLLGIYLLVRLSLDFFVMTPVLNTLLMAAGALTIVVAVLLALVQHDLKRLLGYHAVSQVGYMVLGIGTGNIVGLAGGLFHMLNHVLYKSCLFFGAGAVEKQTGTTDLDGLGGLSRTMPITFATFFVASLAISGVPPLNGFASKWMIYQGILETGRAGGGLWVVWLVAAMLGSALTLASFMKLVHAVFLGQPSRESPAPGAISKDVEKTMWIPMAVLACLCVVFGVLAIPLPMRFFIVPSLGSPVSLPGLWSPGLSTLLILTALVIGGVIFALGSWTRTRETDSFVGGEDLNKHPDMRVSGTDFYRTIQELPGLRSFYDWGARQRLDPYCIGRDAALRVTRVLQRLHHGVLPTYLAWCLLGAVVLMAFLVR